MSQIKMNCAFDADEDQENRKLRELKYDTQRERLIKLADMIDGERELSAHQYRGERVNDTTVEFFFDMRKNLEEEGLPGAIIHIMRPCVLAKRKEMSCLPNFVSFQRVRSEVRLTVNNF